MLINAGLVSACLQKSIPNADKAAAACSDFRRASSRSTKPGLKGKLYDNKNTPLPNSAPPPPRSEGWKEPLGPPCLLTQWDQLCLNSSLQWPAHHPLRSHTFFQRFAPLLSISLNSNLLVPSSHTATAPGAVLSRENIASHPTFLHPPFGDPQPKQTLFFPPSCAGHAPWTAHHPQCSQLNSCQLIHIFPEQQCSNQGRQCQLSPR